MKSDNDLISASLMTIVSYARHTKILRFIQNDRWGREVNP